MTKKKDASKIKGKDKSKLLIDRMANEDIRVPEFDPRPKKKHEPPAEPIPEESVIPSLVPDIETVDCEGPLDVVSQRAEAARNLTTETIKMIISDMVDLLLRYPDKKVMEYTLPNYSDDVVQMIFQSLSKKWLVKLDGSGKMLVITTPEIPIFALSVQQGTSPPL